MNVTRKEQRIIQRALNAWQASGELTPAATWLDAARLPFDWRRLSRYAFWTALACVLIALGSLFADSVGGGAAGPAAGRGGDAGGTAGSRLLRLGWSRGGKWHYSTEAILFLGVVFTAVALWQLGERLDNGSGHIAPLFLAGCVIYGAIGYSPLRAGVAFFCWRWATGLAQKPATSRGGAPTGWA
jgi:hypothetical protein